MISSIQGPAPLAKQESLQSLNNASTDSSVKDEQLQTHTSQPPSSSLKAGLRPQSEYNSESARFVPKLPPKKKVKSIRQHQMRLIVNQVGGSFILCLENAATQKRRHDTPRIEPAAAPAAATGAIPTASSLQQVGDLHHGADRHGLR